MKITSYIYLPVQSFNYKILRVIETTSNLHSTYIPKLISNLLSTRVAQIARIQTHYYTYMQPNDKSLSNENPYNWRAYKENPHK